jgi:hypothetical protein
MRGDYSRFTFDHKKHYSSVRMQQGRLQLDSDWNEAQDIQLDHERMLALDAIGPSGGPSGNAGFKLSYIDTKDDLLIGMGRYYVDGILCENDGDIFYSEQPHHPPKIRDLPSGRYIAYLDVWENVVTAIEDPDIREVALGGPDTATRFKVMWQLILMPLSEHLRYATEGRSQARMAAKIERGRSSNNENNPCSVSINDGYGYLGNYLYRIEIHDGGSQASATFKWSRDNCSVIRSLESIDKRTITILDPSRNAAQIFHPGQFVEITNDERELKGENGEFARIESIDDLRLTLNREIPAQSLQEKPKLLLWDGEPRPICYRGGWIKVEVRGERTVRLLPDADLSDIIFEPDSLVEISSDRLAEQGRFLYAQVESVTSSSDGISLSLIDVKGDLDQIRENISEGCNPRVRKWNPDDDWIDIEMDIKVAFSKGDEYQKGDYWLIPSREITGRIIWPKDSSGQPEFLPRQGVIHHIAKIADIERHDMGWKLVDRRNIFPQLSSILSIAYGGGDAQHGWPGEILEDPFLAIVTSNGMAVAGKNVVFRIVKGEGRLMSAPGAPGSSEAIIKTDEHGIAGCYCQIESHEIVVDARLEDSLLIDDSSDHLSMHSQSFKAKCLDAENVGYNFPPEYPEPGDRRTVKEALDRLSRPGRADRVMYSPSEKGRMPENIKTVGEALDDLYSTAPASSCAVGVGSGGKYQKLDEALLKMREQEKNDICLCLLPGEHLLPEGLQLEGNGSLNLSIRGLGAGSKIVINEGQRIIFNGLQSLHLENIEIEGLGQNDGIIIIKDVDLLSVQRCIIRAAGRDDIAIAIKNGEGSLSLDGNLIDGVLCLYEGNADGAFSFGPENADSFKRRVCHLLSRVRRGKLTLCNNQITRISIGHEMAKKIMEQLVEKHEGKPSEMKDIFQVIILSNNIISRGPNLLLAGNLILNGNFFGKLEDIGHDPQAEAMNWAISGKSVFAGNIGDDNVMSVVSSENNALANLLKINEL